VDIPVNKFTDLCIYHFPAYLPLLLSYFTFPLSSFLYVENGGIPQNEGIRRRFNLVDLQKKNRVAAAGKGDFIFIKTGFQNCKKKNSSP